MKALNDDQIAKLKANVERALSGPWPLSLMPLDPEVILALLEERERLLVVAEAAKRIPHRAALGTDLTDALAALEATS